MTWFVRRAAAPASYVCCVVTTVRGQRILLYCARPFARTPLQESTRIPGLSARTGRNCGAIFIGVHHLDQCHGMKPHQLALACSA